MLNRPMAMADLLQYAEAMKKIADVMTPHAKCISPETSLTTAASIMRDLNVGALPVCENDRVIGIVTDRDLAIRGIAEARELRGTPVRAIMSEEIACISSEQDVEDAARIMEVKQIRRLPVLNSDGRLAGMVSLGDLAVLAGVQISGEALQIISGSPHPDAVS